MAAINVVSVTPDTNGAVPFTHPYSFTIEYECLCPLQEDLEWKMIYVGSAESEAYDQVLDSVLVGPVLQGSYKFVFEGNAPDPSKIPTDDLVGVTVVLLTCSYKSREFIRVGYYVAVEYLDEHLRDNPPDTPDATRLWRAVLTDHPRVTRFWVNFDEPGQGASVGQGSEADQQTSMQEDEPMLTGSQQPYTSRDAAVAMCY